MDSRSGLFVVIFAMAAASLACQQDRAINLPNQEPATRSMAYGEDQRSYVLLPPEREAPESGLIVGLHGGGGDGKQFCQRGSGVSGLAGDAGFLVVCPDAVEGHWNDGRSVYRYRSQREEIDDIGFLSTLISQITSEFGIDPDRVYLAGASNGGMMAYRMACEAPQPIRAAAAMIASLPAALTCRPDRSTPILIMNGTDDPLMPFDGGNVTFLGRPLGGVRSTQDTFQIWGLLNECRPPVRVTHLPDTSEADGSQVVRHEFSGCVDGAEVVLYEVIGGGHTLPGGVQYAPRWLIGKTNRDVSAAQIVLDFFDQHR